MVIHHCLKPYSTSSMSACIVVENTSIDTCIPRQFYCSIPPPKVVISFVYTYAILAKIVERYSHTKAHHLSSWQLKSVREFRVVLGYGGTAPNTGRIGSRPSAWPWRTSTTTDINLILAGQAVAPTDPLTHFARKIHFRCHYGRLSRCSIREQ